MQANMKTNKQTKQKAKKTKPENQALAALAKFVVSATVLAPLLRVIRTDCGVADAAAGIEAGCLSSVHLGQYQSSTGTCSNAGLRQYI